MVGSGIAALLVEITYWSAAGGLVVFGLYYLVIVALRFGVPAPPGPPTLDEPPFITIQIPVRDERYVVERVLTAVGSIDWPNDRLEIQVLDDSTDDTSAIIDRAADALHVRGRQVEVIRRPDPKGYKAGALNEGLRRARGTVIAIFDADFVPPIDFLHRTVPALQPPEVSCVQTRWEHLNESYSWLTRSLALALDAHFVIEQEVRSHHGLVLSFNATACVWKREALEHVGGWSTRTATEDLDLTIRVLASGRRLLYLDLPRVPCEIPSEVLGFARQQARWARGGAQNLRLHAGTLMGASTLTFWQRVDTAFHLSHYGFQIFVLLLFLASMGSIVFDVVLDPPTAAALAIAAAVGPLLLLVDGQRRTQRNWMLRLWRILPLTLVGVGVSLRVGWAFLGGLTGRRWTFFRTPKYSIAGKTGNWRGKAYVPRADGKTAAEALLAVVALTTASIGMLQGRYAIALSVAGFGLCFAWVALHSVLEGLGKSATAES